MRKLLCGGALGARLARLAKRIDYDQAARVVAVASGNGNFNTLVAAVKAAGLVETRRQGREVICTLSSDTFDRFHERERELLGLAS